MITRRLKITSFALLLTAGCATTNGPKLGKEDPMAAEKSRAYLSGIELATTAGVLSDAKSCKVPPEADKPSPGPTAGPSKDWRLLVAHANGCVRDKNWKVLETLANAIARLDIDSPWGAYYLSVAAEGSGDLPRAIWMAELAQKKTGGRSGLFGYQKGRVLFALSETTLAMREIERALAIDPTLAEGQFFLGQIHDRDLEADQALKCYQAAIAADPRHYGALTASAEIKIQKGAGPDAVALLNKAIEARPDQLRAWIRLAFVYETIQKDPALALSTYKGMKQSMDSGSLRERPDFDLPGKIKALETVVQSRVPAQASTATVDKSKSVK